VIQRVADVNEQADEQLAELDSKLGVALELIEAHSEEEARLRGTISSLHDIYETGTEQLNSVGLPGTVEQAREDPDIAAALDEGTPAAMSQLDPDQLQRLDSVLERENAHQLQVIVLENELQAVSEAKQEAHRNRQELEAERIAVSAELDSTIAELEALMSTTDGQEPDWTVCTGRG
jgi:hypothetical protein